MGTMGKVAALAAAGLMAGAVLVASPTTATAARLCTVSGPTRISIDRPLQAVQYKLVNCPLGAHASWNLIHPSKGSWNVATFDGKRVATVDVSGLHPIGASSLRPSTAYDASYSEALVQNRVAVTVKAGGRGSLSTARRGRTVTLAGTASYYSPSTRRFVPRSATSVTVQSRSCPSCAWTKVATVRTDAAGRATTSVRAAKAADYRLVVPGTTTVWDATSRPVRR